MSYSRIYTELEIIGRGNFGAAYLALHKQENQKYVAKKIILGALNDKEVEASHREAELLSRLDHPNIVKYKESFCENNLLIIIMEYCEVGDLSYHVKQKRKRQEFFTETEIMNWFVQLALALQYVHSNKVLHRDIKGSNIYLTSNNTVKIGDFGISRVLEGSVEVANTVIGTPYYMAPEVCQNKPYTFKSDVWSLGCVIYELCTLQHAFNADNLLGLVFKIVSETAEPIPSRYSPQLRQLVQSMLAKDDRARPSISQIMASNYVQNQMESFVNTHGQTLVRTLTVRRMLTRDPDKPLPPEETPKERMLRMKREQAEREAEVMRQAARAAYHDKEISRQRKQEMIFSSFHQTPQARAMVHASAQPVNQFSNSGSTIASIAFNDQNSWDSRVRRPSDPTDTYNMSITVSSLSSTDAREKMPLNTDTYDLSISSPNYPSYYNPYDDIPINSSGQYNLAILEAEETDEVAEPDQSELEKVVDLYRCSLSNRGTAPMEGTFYSDPEPLSQSRIPIRAVINDKCSSLRLSCIEKMGQNNFQRVYYFMKQHRERGTEDAVILEQAKALFGKQASNYCLLVDQLIFVETQTPF